MSASPENADSHVKSPLMEFNIQFLHLVGLWPLGIKLSLKRKVYSFYTFYVTSVYILFIISGIMYLLLEENNIDEFTDNISILISCLLTVVKITPFILFKHFVKNTIDILRNISSNRTQDLMETSILNNANQRIKKFTIAYLSIYISTAFFWLVQNLFNAPQKEMDSNSSNTTNSQKLERTLPFLGWFPYDMSHSPKFELSYTFQILAAQCGVNLISSTNCFFIALLINACTQFKILNHLLRNMNKIAIQRLHERYFSKQNVMLDEIDPQMICVGDDISPHSLILKHLSYEDTKHSDCKDSFYYTQKDLDLEMKSCLAECVKHHQMLLSYNKNMQVLLDPILFGECLVTSFLLCCIIFNVASLPVTSVEFLAKTCYLFAVMMQLLCYCYLGSELIQQSSLVHQAAYACEWYNCNNSFKKSLRLLIMRAQKPSTIQAFSFSTVSLTLYITLLKTSYSYYALLRQVQET